MNKRFLLRPLAILLCAVMMLAVMPVMQLAASTAITEIKVSQTVPTGGYTPREIEAWYGVDLGYSAPYNIERTFYKSTAETPSLTDEDSWVVLDTYDLFEAGATYAAAFEINLTDASYEFDPAVAVIPEDGVATRIVDLSADAITFAILFAPAIGFAADSYRLAVGGVDVTPANAADIFGDGTAVYDPATRTLTLDGADIRDGFTPFAGERYGIESLDALNIEVKGTNVIDLSALDMGDTERTAGIWVDDALTITGDGDLTVTAGDAQSASYGLFASGDLTLRFAGAWSVNAGAAVSFSTAVYTRNSLILEADAVGAMLAASGRFQGLFATKLFAADFAVKATYNYGGMMGEVEWSAFHPNFNAYSTVRLTAVEPEAYTLSVAGVPVTDLNKNNILGDGTASYDPATRTLTLKNANLTHAATFTSPNIFGTGSAVIYAAQPLTVNLVGDNVIDLSAFTFGACDCVNAIIGDSARLSITGDGNLTVKGGTATGIRQYGIRSYYNLDITMTGDLSISAPKDQIFVGIATMNGTLDMDMAGKWTIDIGESDTAISCMPILSYNSTTLRNAGTGTLISGEHAHGGLGGIYVDGGDLTLVNKGSLTVTTGDVGSGDSVGLCVTYDLTILNDGDLTVTAGDAADDSYGILVPDGAFTLVNNGTMTIATGDAADDSDAIDAYALSRLSGKGTLTATTGDSRYASAFYGGDFGRIFFGGSGAYTFSVGTTSDWNAALYSGKVILQDAASVTVNVDKSTDDNANGIQALSDILVTTSGDLTVTVGKAGGWSVGLNSNETVSLLGTGDVTVTAGKGVAGSDAVYCDAFTVNGPGNVSLIADADTVNSCGVEASEISLAGTTLDNAIYLEGGKQAMSVCPTFDPDFYAVTASADLPADLQSVGLNVTNFDAFRAVKLTSLVKTVDDTVYGDAAADGSIDMKDVLIIRKFIANLIGEDGLNLANADANGDGDVNMKDVLFIRQYIANLIEHLGPAA